MLYKNKITVLMAILALGSYLYAHDTQDFNNLELPPDILGDVGGPIIGTIDSITKYVIKAPSKIQDFVIENPKQSALVAGVLIAGVGLGLNEMLQRNREGLAIHNVYSRPGLLKMPFQHGVRPYFLGLAVGGATGVGIKRAKLNRTSKSLSEKAQNLNNKVALVEKSTKQHLLGSREINKQAAENNTSACRTAQDAGQISAQVSSLKTELLQIKTDISKVVDTVEGLGQRTGLVINITGELNTSILSSQQTLDSFKKQNQAVGAVQQASFFVSFYKLGRLVVNQAQWSSAVTQHTSGLNDLTKTGEQMQTGLIKAHSSLEAVSDSIVAADTSIHNSIGSIQGIKRRVVSCTGGSGSE